mgnify:CR=1 FL=1
MFSGVLGNAAFDFQGNTHHDWLLQAYNESKVTQSVKGEILRLLGKLVEKFPLEMMDKGEARYIIFSVATHMCTH